MSRSCRAARYPTRRSERRSARTRRRITWTTTPPSTQREHFAGSSARSPAAPGRRPGERGSGGAGGAGPSFEPANHVEAELGRTLAVDDTVVEGDRDVPDGAYDDLTLAHHRALGDPMHTEDPDLRRIDQRRDEEARELPRARDRERAAAKLLRCEPAVARGVGEALDLGVELLERARIAVAHHRDDEALVRRDRDPDVVAVEVDELAVLDARVQLGERTQRLGDGAEHERHEQRQIDVREVALLDPRHRGNLPVRARHVLAHQAPHAANRLAPPFARPLWLRAATSRGDSDVVFGDPALRARRCDRGEVDVELLSDLPHERRRAEPFRS